MAKRIPHVMNDCIDRTFMLRVEKTDHLRTIDDVKQRCFVNMANFRSLFFLQMTVLKRGMGGGAAGWAVCSAFKENGY